jgi:hypothetical protein
MRALGPVNCGVARDTECAVSGSLVAAPGPTVSGRTRAYAVGKRFGMRAFAGEHADWMR